MKRNDALNVLLSHTCSSVRATAAVIQKDDARRKGILQLVQGALGQLRLDMKYLMFDLQATRRERDALKAKLGEQT